MIRLAPASTKWLIFVVNTNSSIHLPSKKVSKKNPRKFPKWSRGYRVIKGIRLTYKVKNISTFFFESGSRSRSILVQPSRWVHQTHRQRSFSCWSECSGLHRGTRGGRGQFCRPVFIPTKGRGDIVLVRRSERTLQHFYFVGVVIFPCCSRSKVRRNFARGICVGVVRFSNEHF